MAIFEWIIIVTGIAVSILLIIAVLTIPRIAKYQKATMKLTALMAIREGIDKNTVHKIVHSANLDIAHESEWIETLKAVQAK